MSAGADKGCRHSCGVPSAGQFPSIFPTLKRHNLRDKSQSSERVTTQFTFRRINGFSGQWPRSEKCPGHS